MWTADKSPSPHFNQNDFQEILSNFYPSNLHFQILMNSGPT